MPTNERVKLTDKFQFEYISQRAGPAYGYFCMREVGFELDKWFLSKKRDILKLHDTRLGPDESRLKKKWDRPKL